MFVCDQRQTKLVFTFTSSICYSFYFLGSYYQFLLIWLFSSSLIWLILTNLTYFNLCLVSFHLLLMGFLFQYLAISCIWLILDKTNLCWVWRVRLIKYWPDPVLGVHPPAHCPVIVIILKTKLPRDLLVTRLVCVKVQPVQDSQSFLSVTVLKKNRIKKKTKGPLGQSNTLSLCHFCKQTPWLNS